MSFGAAFTVYVIGGAAFGGRTGGALTGAGVSCKGMSGGGARLLGAGTGYGLKGGCFGGACQFQFQPVCTPAASALALILSLLTSSQCQALPCGSGLAGLAEDEEAPVLQGSSMNHGS